MSKNYVITVKDTEQPENEISFQFTSHDDLIKVISLSDGKTALPEEHIYPFLIGMKLFGEVVMLNRKDEMFKKIHPALKEFIGDFKKSIKNSQ
ncbi:MULTISPECIES: DUF3861 family protein [unclassified Brenneria]|uniref:DUF3861 family protein n=1 Tax=unclassified Brenneria TaxID=2634434 RepID=UPI001551B42C|nr:MULTISPECIES: DUF3861 family protein [unclassified Brenneria]MBJ7222542.1 DUF3861 family protein [Brenneria sp. L3-3C-1]MEE3643785.1 DUF3861 family protein [Brenneria sp. L3_3C_1]MEE3651262.1 DUF3861 family protein [Brenneria sp. HEZEL_4_2_4]NPD01218.1 DUF3861 family protein [Brenneria sp. hezel4-2-4]